MVADHELLLRHAANAESRCIVWRMARGDIMGPCKRLHGEQSEKEQRSMNPTPTTAATTPQYTEYQQEFSRAYGVHPSLAPASADELPNTNPTGKRKIGLQISPPAPLTLEEQARDLADKYGVRDARPFLEQLRKEAGEDLIAQRLERRAALAKKYGVKPEHIPLEWLKDEEAQ